MAEGIASPPVGNQRPVGPAGGTLSFAGGYDLPMPHDAATPSIDNAAPMGASWLFDGPADERLAFFTDTMRAISRHTDPQRLVLDYYHRMKQAFPTDGYIALSRRDLPQPLYRVTRSSRINIDFDPWKQAHQRPVHDRGFLGELLYRGDAVVLDDLTGYLRDGDPAFDLLEGQRSLMAVPMFDDGKALNMTIFLREKAGAFDRETLPEQVWVSNLFGRATSNLVLRQQLAGVLDRLRRELDAVGEIQKSLLPSRVPEVPGVRLATFYDASEQAGGDYYDFFELPGGRLGLLVADVSGHGTPAAVLMAVLHAIVHSIDNPPHAEPPGRVLAHLNRHLCERYTKKGGTFVTAWFGMYDPETRELTYANAGHPAPRLKHDNGRNDDKAALAGPLSGNARSLPLGIDPHEVFENSTVTLEPGDVLVAYTDGITESRAPAGDMFGVTGLDETLLGCSCDPKTLISDLVDELSRYTHDTPPGDDRTIVAMKVK